MHESEQRRRLSPPAARAALPASPRPFPQPDPSPQSPSSVTSLCRVFECKVAAPSVIPGRVIGQKRIDQNLGLDRLDAKCGMAVTCLFHGKFFSSVMWLFAGNVSYLSICLRALLIPLLAIATLAWRVSTAEQLETEGASCCAVLFPRAHLSERAIWSSQVCRFVPWRHHLCTRSAKVITRVESHTMRLLLRSSAGVLEVVRPTDTRASRF